MFYKSVPSSYCAAMWQYTLTCNTVVSEVSERHTPLETHAFIYSMWVQYTNQQHN